MKGKVLKSLKQAVQDKLEALGVSDDCGGEITITDKNQLKDDINRKMDLILVKRAK